MNYLRTHGRIVPILGLMAVSLLFLAGRQLATPMSQTVISARAPLDLRGSPPGSADRLYAQLWMDTAPEYRALCLQAFRAALGSVRAVAHAAPEISGRRIGASGKPLAVVTDLDETILDNSGYQAQLAAAGVDYSRPTWNQWVEQEGGVQLIPGARAFIEEIEGLGVTMIYLSNRPDSLRSSTISTLNRLGIDASQLQGSEPRLLLRTSESDKTARRRRARDEFEIVAFLGDNLGDFPKLLTDFPDQNLQLVDRWSEMWGTRWFVLPNPTYGSWARVFSGTTPQKVIDAIVRNETEAK